MVQFVLCVILSCVVVCGFASVSPSHFYLFFHVVWALCSLYLWYVINCLCLKQFHFCHASGLLDVFSLDLPEKSRQPSAKPWLTPSSPSSSQPSCQASNQSIQVSSAQPTIQPSSKPSVRPYLRPAEPSRQPSCYPTSQPSVLSSLPSRDPTSFLGALCAF